MKHPRILVDFQNADPAGRVRLRCNGTLEDLQRQSLELHEGQMVTVWEDDLDEHDRPQLLVADGVVTYSADEQCWVAAIDWDAIQYVPDTHTESVNGVPTNANLPLPVADQR
jgi:hypothetical protein